MPPHTNATDSDLPRTRSKNANAHPGTAAQDALRVKAPRRDPATIQKEKDAIKERKESKAQQKILERTRNEATKSIADEFRARQVSNRASEGAEMPRQTPKVVGNTVPANAAVPKMGSTNTGTTGKKRKGETQVGIPILAPPPRKRTRATVEPSHLSATRTHGAPSNTKAMDTVASKGARKRLGDEISINTDQSNPETPARPLKKVKTNKPVALTKAPIRRTETMIFESGSRVATRRPRDNQVHDLESENEDEGEGEGDTTLRQQDFEQSEADPSEGPYETPFVLRKRRDPVQAEDDTEKESETEGVEVRKRQKKLEHVYSSDELSSDNVTTSHRDVTTKSSRSSHQSNRKNAPLTNISASNDSGSKSSRSVSAHIRKPVSHVSGASMKSRTTSENGVAIARTDVLKSKSKKSSKKNPVIEVSDSEDDDSLERQAALISPAKGAESRKATKGKVTKVDNEPSPSLIPIPAGKIKSIKTIVIPYFIAIYMAAPADPWRPLTQEDFDTLENLFLRACGEPLGYKITENTEFAKLTKSRLYDLRNKIGTVGQDVVKEKFVKQHGKAALGDNEKRMEFGLEWCKDGEFKFIYSGLDNSKKRLSGKFTSSTIVDTFAEFFKFGEAATILPEFEVQKPISALALAIASVERAFSLYRDGKLDYKDDVLVIKKDQVLVKNEKGSIYKEVRLVKFDFSSANYRVKVTGWRLSIEKKTDTLFPAICDRARITAGVTPAIDPTQIEYQDPEILARLNLESESESEDEDEDRDGGGKEIGGKEGEDREGDDKDIGGDFEEGEDQYGNDKDISTEEGEDQGEHDSHISSAEEDEDKVDLDVDRAAADGTGGDSELTEVGSTSDLAEIEAVLAPNPTRRSGRKGVQPGRR